MIDITANVIRLIHIDTKNEEQITNVLDVSVQFNNISTVIDVQVPIGGGLTYTLKQWVSPISDTHVPGLASLIDLETNYRRIDDDSINNYTYIKQDNTTLLNQIQNFQNQIDDLQKQINNLP